MTIEEQRGYDAALKESDAQVAMNQSLADCEPNDFTRGWQKACEERGAIHPLD